MNSSKAKLLIFDVFHTICLRLLRRTATSKIRRSNGYKINVEKNIAAAASLIPVGA